MRFPTFIAFTLFCIGSNAVANSPLHPLTNKSEREKALLQIYRPHPYTFFCHYPFNTEGRIDSGVYQHSKRTDSVQWIPLVTKVELARERPCYTHKICVNSKGDRYKGLLCCHKVDPLYNAMLADLHLYVPVHPQLSQKRKKYHFEGLSEDTALEKQCQLYFDEKTKTMMPSDTLKGEIARVYLYMHKTYGLTLPESKLALYQAWHKSFPSSPWEKTKNQKIAQLQGNRNDFTS